MELELQKEHFACYRSGLELSDTHEETAETIVPDYSPDVARIVDASACLLLRSTEIADGRASVSGVVKMNVLYMAEDTQSVRAIDYTLPVEHSFEGRLPEQCAEAALSGSVSACEVRLLNPRKLFTRVTVTLTLTPYCRVTLTTCGAVAGEEEYRIETLCERHEVSLLRAVREKEFTFADEIALGGREPIRELLRAQAKLRVTECKALGGKAILKGVACIELLYLSDSGGICPFATELPFSQIIEGLEEGAGASAEAALRLTGCEIHTGGEGGGDGRTISVKLLISAFVTLRQEESVCCITDLYSTSNDLDAQTETVELPQPPEYTTLTQNVREQIDTAIDVKCVLSAGVCFGAVAAAQNGGRTSLRVPATVKVLYLDENDVPLLAERRCEVTVEGDVPAAARVSVAGICGEDIETRINAGGIEARFTVEFTVMSADSLRCACLTGLKAEACAESKTDAPSLVLRALRGEEKLWDLAKQYRTTVGDILSVNGMEPDGVVPKGTMLLIPRKR